MAAIGQTSVTITNPEIISETTANGPNWFYDSWLKMDSSNKLFLTWLGDKRCNGKPRVPQSDWEREIAEEHNLTPEQLGWVVETRDTKCARRDAMFDQEYPTTPERAFVLGGRPYFDNKYDEAIGYVETDDEEIDWRRCDPRMGHIYTIGIDPASGAPAPDDASAAVVLDVTNTSNMMVVHTVRVREPQVDFAERCIKLAREYKALSVPERCLGLTVVDALLSARPKIRIYRRPVFDNYQKTWSVEAGWSTNHNTRKFMLEQMNGAMKDGRLDPGDIRLKAEINSFRHGRRRAEAAPGCHDDLAMACGMALMGADQVSRVAEEQPVHPPTSWDEQRRLEKKVGRKYNRNDPAFGGSGNTPKSPSFHGY